MSQLGQVVKSLIFMALALTGNGSLMFVTEFPGFDCDESSGWDRAV